MSTPEPSQPPVDAPEGPEALSFPPLFSGQAVTGG
ncbi:hypothetical protein LCGC14_3164680, partial [marine sediment metagenome]